MDILLRTLAVISLLWIHPVLAEFQLGLVPEQLLNRKTGENLLIRCKVKESDGDEEVSLSWVKVRGTGMEEEMPENGRARAKPFNGDAKGMDLMFVPSEKSDEGTYKCVGKRGDESQEISITFSLFEKIKFVDCPVVQNPQAGTDAEIRCRVTADPMPDDITWNKDGLMVNDESMTRTGGYRMEEDNMVLVLPGYDPDTDDGTYTVSVTQMQSGDFQERHITVTGHVVPSLEHFPSEITKGFEGKDLSLTCSGIGRPEPEYKWYKGASGSEDMLISKTGDKYNVDVKGQLVIADLIEDDAMSFTCLALNDVGSDQKTTTVEVLLKPRIEPIANLTESRGSAVSLECRYKGDGEVKVEWIFKGRILGVPNDEDQSQEGAHVYTEASEGVLALKIDSLMLDDADEYQCRAENKAGEAVTRVFLSVHHAPAFVRQSEETQRALMMTEVKMFCEVEAVPPPKWTWTGPQGDLSDIDPSDNDLHSQITVLVDDEGKFGEYMCKADNGVDPPAEHFVRLLLIKAPPTPSGLSVEERFPNSARVIIQSFGELKEGEEPEEVILYYHKTLDLPEDPTDQFWNDSKDKAPLHFVSSNPMEYRLPGLEPETAYTIRAKAVNKAGASAFSEPLPYETSAARAPMAPVFVSKWGSECGEMCVVEWEEPDNQGADITGFLMEYVVVEERDGVYVEVGEAETRELDGHRRKMDLYHLRPNTFYKFTLSAVNTIGQGDTGDVIVQTGKGVVAVGVSTGAIIGIVIVIILIILVLVDVTCYYVNHCGVLMCLCVNLCGKENPDVKTKEMVHLEEGHTRKNDDKTPLKQPEAEDKATVDNEHTPMMDEQQYQNQKKDTTV